MTLRVTVEIVPYGIEESKKELSRLDISNVELIERGAFGHDICRYIVTETDSEDPETYTLHHPSVIHDRREGYWKLILKALESFLDE